MYTFNFLNQNIYCQFIKMGKDLHVCIHGGDRSHIGASVVTTISKGDFQTHNEVISLPGHRDYIVAKWWSQKLAQALQTTVSCCCGIHYDDIQQTEIEELILKMDIYLDEVIDQVEEEYYESI